MKTHNDIIDLWPTRAAFARDVGVYYGMAVGWNRRNNIPSEYWAHLVRAAKARGFHEVTTDLLAEIQKIDLAPVKTDVEEVHAVS